MTPTESRVGTVTGWYDPRAQSLTDNGETHDPTVAADVDTIREFRLGRIGGEVAGVAVLVDGEGVFRSGRPVAIAVEVLQGLLASASLESGPAVVLSAPARWWQGLRFISSLPSFHT